MENDKFCWKNTAVELRKDDETHLFIIKIKEECKKYNLKIDIDESEGKFTIYNSDRLLFKEEEYLRKATYFKDILTKLSYKDYKQDLYYISEDLTIDIVKNNDYQIYSSVIENNNIDGIKKKDLGISIEILEKLEQNKEIKKIINIYIMLFLANKTSFKTFSQN